MNHWKRDADALGIDTGDMGVELTHDERRWLWSMPVWTTADGRRLEGRFDALVAALHKIAKYPSGRPLTEDAMREIAKGALGRVTS